MPEFAAPHLKGREHGKDWQTGFGKVSSLSSWRNSPDRVSGTGHCVLTVGTDDKTLRKIEGVKLLPTHAYAVVGESTKVISDLGYIVSTMHAHGWSNLDIRETESERWLTLINSTVPTASSSFYAESENRSGPSNSRECWL